MKKVLITGGNKGIGLATTKIFLENQYFVYVLARDFTFFELKRNKAVKAIEFNLQQISEIPRLKEEIGDIDILINNAGMMFKYPYDNYPENQRDLILKVNLEAPIKLIEAFSESMLKKGHGRIVNISSIAAYIGHPDIWYGITKAGLLNATRSFAKILGPKGIIVNAVAPGPVNTEMLIRTIPKERQEMLKKNSILGRVAEPEEVAKTVYWLATESPDYINGVCVDINDGMYFK